MLIPSKVKYRKQQRGRMKGITFRGSTLEFGDFALQAVTGGWVRSKQLEAGRIAIARCIQKMGKVWVRVFADKPVSKKPAETRMGKGKGNPEYWVAVVKPGRIMFEVGGLPAEQALAALRSAQYKFPIKTKVVSGRPAGE